MSWLTSNQFQPKCVHDTFETKLDRIDCQAPDLATPRCRDARHPRWSHDKFLPYSNLRLISV